MKTDEPQGVYETIKPQTIFRVVHNPNNPYVIVDKRIFEKPYMSWKAKGLLVYLLSRPDDWTVRLGDLAKRSTDKMHASRQALRELLLVGHARQVEYRTTGGRTSHCRTGVSPTRSTGRIGITSE